MTAFAFFSLFAALTAVYMLFLFRIRSGIRYLYEQQRHDTDHDTGRTENLPFLTVLVPMRDEAPQLEASAASLAAQQYPSDRLEVLYIDDHSTDGSAEEAERLLGQDARFRVLHCSESESGKKDALTRGVQEARGEIIVTTDADCTHDPVWLRTLTSPFVSGADVVAGPVVFTNRERFFTRLQAMEFLGLVGVGAGFFGIGYPRLCNGANFAYRRSCFDAAAGYSSNREVVSGDDEFLLHDIVYRQGGHAQFVSRESAIVRTPAAGSVREFLQQRIRWSSKASKYIDRRFVSFLVVLFVYFLFAATAPVISLGSPAALAAGILFFLLKCITDAAVLFAAASLFRQPLRPVDLLAAEFLHAYYIVVVSAFGFFGVFSWKNRNLKKG
ncbi:glycosyltransferase [bacterium]|nr:glycosyltransferase [bacterium]